MSYPLVMFVDAPDPAANVRFDCNRSDGPAPRKVEADGFTLGFPTIEGDPDAIGVTYGYRQPSFVENIKGPKSEALATLSSLSRELLRQTNWVLVQLDAFTAPIWLRIYRSAFAPLSLDQVRVDVGTGDPVLVPDTWKIQVPLLADAFAYGERVTHDALSFQQTITGDTTGGASPMVATLPAIKGDAPTALRVAVTNGASSSSEGAELLIGCVSGTNDLVTPVFDIGTSDGFTADVGTSSPSTSSGSAYVNGSYRTVTVAADDGGAGTSLARRLFGTTSVEVRGRFKVQLRCEATSASGVTSYLFRMDTNADTTGGVVSWDVGTPLGGSVVAQGWVDLGEFTFPRGTAVPMDVVQNDPAVEFTLYVGVAGNGAGTVRVDAVQFLPVDGEAVASTSLLRSTLGADWGPGVTVVWDGAEETSWFESGGYVFSAKSNSRGGFPVADPAQEQSLLVVMATKHNAITAHSTAYETARRAPSSVVVSYQPRLLHLGDGT